jgi:hypothetical protein
MAGQRTPARKSIGVVRRIAAVADALGLSVVAEARRLF